MTSKESNKEDLLPRYNKEHDNEVSNTHASIKWLSNINDIVDNNEIVNKSKTLKKVKRKVHILYVIVTLSLVLMVLFVRVFVLPQYAMVNNSEDQLFVPQNIDYKPDHFLVTQENVMMNDEIKDSRINMEKAKDRLYQSHSKETTDSNGAKKEFLYKGSDIKALKQSDDDKKNKELKKQSSDQISDDPPFRKSQDKLDKQISNGKI